MEQKSIATGAVFASLIAVLTGMAYVFPGIEMLFVFFLPFFSSYISFKFGFKKSLPFFIASLIVSCLINYLTSLIYVLPSLISGIIYGFLSRKINKIIDLTFIMSFVEAILFAFSMWIISVLFKFDVTGDLPKLLSINNQTFNNNLYLYLYIIGIVQASFTSLVISQNYKKLMMKEFEYKSGLLILIFNIASILCILLVKNTPIFRLAYVIYFVTLFIQVVCSFGVKLKYNWIFSVIQIITFLFVSIPVLTIISESLKLFVYSWFLIPLIVKNCLQVFNFVK